MADKTRIYELTETTDLSPDLNFAVDTESGGTKRVQLSTLIDDQLHEEGKAADAAAVGTALDGKVDKETGKGLVAIDSTLTQAGQAADAKKTGDEITGLKSDFNELNGDVVRLDEDGKMYIKGVFVLGTLNTSGQIAENNRRIVTRDIISYGRDINITFATNYQGIYVTYDNSEQFVARTITLGPLTVPKNQKFRLCIMFTGSEPELADIPTFKEKATIDSYINERITDNTKAIFDLQNNETDISSEVTYELGHFIQPDGTVSSLGAYAISDLITLQSGETIVIQANGGTADVISMLSKWDSTGTVFVANLYTCTGDLTETITHTATETEYLKICYLSTKGLPSVIIKMPTSTELLAKIEGLKADTLDLFPSLSMFDNIAVCGDSYTAGSIFVNNVYVGDNAKTRWGTVLSRMSGADVTTYASGGADTDTWQSRTDCLPKLLTDDPYEMYVLCLGINDRTYVTLGTINDIKSDYTQNPNTFYGNYGKIIAQIQNHAPNAKILISKVFIVTYQTGAYYNWSSDAIEEIADHFGIPYIETADCDFFSSAWFNANIKNGHPVAPTYSGIAKGMKYLIEKAIEENTEYFIDYYPT